MADGCQKKHCSVCLYSYEFDHDLKCPGKIENGGKAMTKQEKAEFISILLSDLKPFWDEIDMAKLITNIDWLLGYTFIYDGDVESLVKLVMAKDWRYEARKNGRPIIKTKYFWQDTGGFFYIVLVNGINLDLYQKTLKFEEQENKEVL